MQATIFFKDQSPVAFPMPPSFRTPVNPENIAVRRFAIFTDPQSTNQRLQVEAFSKWLDRTKNGYFDRVGGDPNTGQRCTEFIILDEKKKIVVEKANTLVLRFFMDEKESMMAREKSKFGRKTVKK